MKTMRKRGGDNVEWVKGEIIPWNNIKYCLIALRAVNIIKVQCVAAFIKRKKKTQLSTHLVGEIVGVKNYFNIACFANKCLWLLCFTTKHSRLAAIWDICFRISIYYLFKEKYEERKWTFSANKFFFFACIKV